MLSQTLAFAGIILSAPTSGPHDAGNVLWVVLDDLSNEYVGAYGEGPTETQPPTPQLDALAAAGMRFTNFYVNPVCSPSRVTFLTGEYAWRSNIGDVDQSAHDLPLSTVTLPDAITPDKSALIGAWKMGTTPWGSFSPVVHGYSLYAGKFQQKDYFNWTRTVSWPWTTATQDFVETYQTSQQVDDTLAIVECMPEPWALTVNLWSVHDPIHTPPDHLHSQGTPSSDEEKYLAMIEAADTEVGRLIAGVDLTTTTVFILSDNGSSGQFTHPPETGKATTFEGCVNCPLIVVGRGVAAGTVTRSLANGVDLFETTLDLIGRSGSFDAADGVSLSPVLADPTASVREFAYGERFSADHVVDVRYARDARYKIRARFTLGDPVEEWLYDLGTAPPGEDGRPLDPDRLTDDQRERFDALRVVIRQPQR